jgi:hypothetical protein
MRGFRCGFRETRESSYAIGGTAGFWTMLDKIVSGGQTGADQAGWRTARTFGIPTGGWMPKGFLTEDGPRPELAKEFSAAEMPTNSYPARTEQNVRDSDATVWFGETTTKGAQETVAACHRFSRPCMLVFPDASFEPAHVARWIAEHQVRTLNVAGNRETDEPGIGDRVERFLAEVLEELGHVQA